MGSLPQSVCPEHARDVALAQKAVRILTAQMRRQFQAGEEAKGKKTNQVRRWALEVCRGLAYRSQYKLPQKCREALMRILNIEELPPLGVAPSPMHLPKRPPHRRHEVEE